MTYGPIDFVALEFKGNNFKGEIIPALVDLITNKTIRVIDLVIVLKDARRAMLKWQNSNNSARISLPSLTRLTRKSMR